MGRVCGGRGERERKREINKKIGEIEKEEVKA
jgi:hypothetical protein